MIPGPRDRAWIAAEWDEARPLTGDGRDALLVLDEVHKITQWSETVKRLWDEDTRADRPLRVLLLGSSPLLVQRGLAESLAGRFEIIRVGRWSLREMRDAFGWDVERYVFFGGHPGAAELVDDSPRWGTYVRDALIETTISRDVLLLQPIQKPALLRQLFALACEYSARVVSCTKLLGQLQDKGNTATLAHYLELLEGAGMIRGLQKYSGSRVRQRGSSPKLLALNTALVSAMPGLTFADARRDPGVWGRARGRLRRARRPLDRGDRGRQRRAEVVPARHERVPRRARERADAPRRRAGHAARGLPPRRPALHHRAQVSGFSEGVGDAAKCLTFVGRPDARPYRVIR